MIFLKQCGKPIPLLQTNRVVLLYLVYQKKKNCIFQALIRLNKSKSLFLLNLVVKKKSVLLYYLIGMSVVLRSKINKLLWFMYPKQKKLIAQFT